jgi:hypothetical protein
MFRIESFQVSSLQVVETIQRSNPMINLAAAAVLVRELTERQFEAAPPRAMRRPGAPDHSDPDRAEHVPGQRFVSRVASVLTHAWPLGKSRTSAC